MHDVAGLQNVVYGLGFSFSGVCLLGQYKRIANRRFPALQIQPTRPQLCQKTANKFWHLFVFFLVPLHDCSDTEYICLKQQ